MARINTNKSRILSSFVPIRAIRGNFLLHRATRTLSGHTESLIRPHRCWVLVAAISLLLFARQGSACLNDTSVERGEEQFRSQYNAPAQPAPASTTINPWGLAGLSIGSGLAVGSLIVAVGRHRRGAA
jgi:hypothetical protein